MARLRLTKQELSRQRRELALYRKMLPSLDLKRRQLTLALAAARHRVQQLRQEVEDVEAAVGADLPMIANSEIDLQGLVRVVGVRTHEENVVGVRLPILAGIDTEVAPYSLLAKPSWVDVLVERLVQVAEQRIQVQVAEQRVRILALQERRTTQRVNLFQHILIPRAQHNIQRIQIFLGDQERAAVARSKLAKKKQQDLRALAARTGPGDVMEARP